MTHVPSGLRRETTLSSERIFEGRAVKLRVDCVRLPDGRQSQREVVEHPGAVGIVPLLPDGRVLLIRQWRHAVDEELLEIPAGTIEPGEDPAECALRELIEETGHEAETLRLLAAFCTSPGFTSERLHLFLAPHLRPAKMALDEDEAILPVALPLAEAVAMCWDGRIRDGKTIAGLLMTERVPAGGEGP